MGLSRDGLNKNDCKVHARPPVVTESLDMQKITIGKDKLYHFMVCLAATILVGIPLGFLSGIWFGLGLGLGKEYGDKSAAGNYWSWGDLLADLLGVVAGALFTILFRTLAGV